MAKIKTHQLVGGYKSYRNEALQSFTKPFNFYVIGGFTGSGKSEILNALSRRGEQILDLEKLSNHKGSVFGGLMQPPQPTTEQFQNNLFEEILKLDVSKRIWVEDESVTIGKIVLPDPFWRRMSVSPMVEMNVSKEIRIRRLVNEYGQSNKEEFLKAMSAIVKKLGGQHFQVAKEKLLMDDMSGVIDILLNYYDKAYATGLLKKNHRIKIKSAWNGNSADDFAAGIIQEAL